MPGTNAAVTLELRIEPPARGAGGVLRRVLGSAEPDPAAGFQAVLVRRASGHEVLRGPVERSLRRDLLRAVDGDLATMTESAFLAAWGGGGSWKQRFERWRERGWVPPVR